MPENIKTRLLKKRDAPIFFQLIDDNRDRLRRYFPKTIAAITDMESCMSYVKEKRKQAKKKELFIFVILADEKLCGVLIVKSIDWRIPKGELAYYIDRNYEGKGIMSKAMDQVTDYLFNELDFNKLFIRISPNNEPSRRLAIKNGFVLEGLLLREFRIETGELEDIEYYGKLK